METTKASNQYREIVAVKFAFPGKGKQHSLVVASVYYRPRSGTTSPHEYAWIQQLLHEANGVQVIIGGDFNAKSDIWGYSIADSRGRLLSDQLDSLPLHICNTTGTHTRAGLHAKQTDTTPDLTIASPKSLPPEIAVPHSATSRATIDVKRARSIAPDGQRKTPLSALCNLAQHPRPPLVRAFKAVKETEKKTNTSGARRAPSRRTACTSRLA
ncbi:hypothetical protein HPB50_018234 [Hyalomma asiaticum]|uniref:Uncharacterized protein n=1 Tax=Hyalomma asiaticum TaxID=266040 RepID=A0ACB7SNQ9_HYAAI|nr:hypothetical protein HPB50_018234 [Hyalomma asiaticum]